MPRDLFGDVTHPSVSVGSRKWYTVPLSLAAHVSIVVPILLVSLIAPEFLPLPRDMVTFVSAAPLPPTPPAPPPPVARKLPVTNSNAAPLETPDAITPDPGFEPIPTDEIGSGIEPGVPGAGTIVGDAPPAPLTSAPQEREAVRVGGHIRMPTKIRDASPVYPVIAQVARVQGTVILEAVIDTDGRVRSLRVLRSVQFLDQAAIDAVSQWHYSPTLLNGTPVPVIATITVTFTLNRN